MSVSIEDLVSSFSSSHIGQEATDLAALQAQLAQILFSQAISNGQESTSYAQPCNTPTRTSSTGFSLGQAMNAQRHIPTRRNSLVDTSRDMDEMEDERMVEDILLPASPMSATAAGTNHFAQQQQGSSPRSRSGSKSRMSVSSSLGPFVGDTSLFATTDPFYLDQLQAIENHNNPPATVFSQLGCPAQHSPFLSQHRSEQPGYPSMLSHHRDTHGYPQLPIDAHSFLVSTSAVFDR